MASRRQENKCKKNGKKFFKYFSYRCLNVVEWWKMKRKPQSSHVCLGSWKIKNRPHFWSIISTKYTWPIPLCCSIFGSSLRLGFKVQNVVWINNTIKVWLSDPIGKQLHILIVWRQCVCIKRDKTLTLTHTGRFMAIHSWMLNHVQLVNLYLLFIFTNFYKCDWVEHFI